MDMSNICLLLFCGLPGAGKTSFARSIRTILHKQGYSDIPDAEASSSVNRQWQCLHVSYDELLPSAVEKCLIESDHRSEHTNSQWKDFRRKIVRCVEKSIREIKLRIPAGQTEGSTEDTIEGMSHCQREQPDETLWQHYTTVTGCVHLFHDGMSKDTKFVILMDDNMYYRSMRYEYYQLARDYEIGFAEIYIPCDTTEALARNARRQDPVADDVIVAMAKKMEPPNPEEPFEENCLIWKHDELKTENICCIMNLLSHAMAHPVQGLSTEDTAEREDSRIVCSANILHQADRMLRKLVTEQMAYFKSTQQCSKEDLRQHAARLNKARIEVLQRMKTDTKLVRTELQTCATDTSGDSSQAILKFVECAFLQSHSVLSDHI